MAVEERSEEREEDRRAGPTTGGNLRDPATGCKGREAMERAVRSTDVIVVGGGAIGLACARALADGGRRVVLVERGRTGSEATRAAGGMLSPVGEASGPGALLTLGLASLERWSAFASALEDASNEGIDLRLDGKLLVAQDAAASERLRRRHAWIREAGLDAEWLPGTATRGYEASVESAVAGLFLRGEGQVDNRALSLALRVAAERAGCRIREGAPAAALETENERIRGVRLENGEMLAADVVVVAAGAWSGELAGLPRPLPVRPVKGQMLALEAPSERPLRTIVETEPCYVIPRRSRRGAGRTVWVGATSEDVGFTRGTTADALDALHAAASRVVTGLTDAREVEAWDGFRPATPDGLPILGPDPRVEGLVHATGHYRNGILLVPITAELCLRAVDDATGYAGDSDLLPFSIGRFAR
jgi:glycine oxidase